MSQSTVTQQQLHTEWTEYYPLARWLTRQKLVRIDGTVPPDIDDRVSEALAHAWQEYPKLRQRRPDIPAKTAIRWACKTAVSRVRSQTRFVPKPYPGYVDAMDGRAQREGYFEDAVPQPDPQPYRDPSDRTAAEALIAALPDELQPTARLLSYGMTKTLAAERRGISRAKLYEQVERIRRLLA